MNYYLLGIQKIIALLLIEIAFISISIKVCSFISLRVFLILKKFGVR